ncbi:uncharacterized protein PAN0_002c1251 [Moesziomyces antarcticus]|uniref:Velvet domain-containing protein n=1 Tax=Pseudozyma antarctica TaxID=84753 RepID=A0A5C3FJ41_PSEA2|nr:uncharacterized protein PAN0_002c1251 [Moesziomyces antarcticus]GAK63049.1 conserved hypothetical protein [Moesziomyces antarcticus]SPO43469.1 uncharacterized protein PSANT_01154 [Moesziomyces antarcticus]
MSRSESDERDSGFATGNGSGPSHASEYASTRLDRHGLTSSADDALRATHDRHRDPYSNQDPYAGGSQRFRGRPASPSQERQYQHELDMMKAREEHERFYATTSSRGGREAPEGNEVYAGVPAVSAEASGFGPRASSSEKPNLDGFSRVENGRRYRLVVVQHPSRARMCGFGDKDRRPLSPTLLVKLVITDEATGDEISPLDVNTSLFLLATDLCHPDDLMLAPRNILVHHHASSLPVHSMQQGGHHGYSQDDYATPHGSSYGNLASEGPSDADYRTGGGFGAGLPRSGSPSGAPDARSSTNPQMSMASSGGNVIAGQGESYTRNLVGAAVASASVLKDEQDKWCIFFVFQDISVRTEGVYRIKLMFVNLEVNGRVGTGVSEALAETYTEPFTVYSPRRFPGMLDPTPLSRKLASQGIKIPVRNDKKKQRRRNDDGDMGPDDDGGSGGDDDDD